MNKFSGRELRQTLVCLAPGPWQHLCTVPFCCESRDILQGTVKSLFNVSLYLSKWCWETAFLKCPFALCSDACMQAVTVRRVRTACALSSPPTHELARPRECFYWNGGTKCAVRIFFFNIIFNFLWYINDNLAKVTCLLFPFWQQTDTSRAAQRLRSTPTNCSDASRHACRWALVHTAAPLTSCP